MKFTELVAEILAKTGVAMTPQEIRDAIKKDYPQFHGTPSHISNVQKGHYSSVDHALQAQVYVAVRKSERFVCDDSVKPLKVSLVKDEDEEEDAEPSIVEALEDNAGTVYILGTKTYTEDRKEIVKIGITTGDVEKRMNQLYSTGVPYKFRAIKIYKVTGFTDLEKGLHNLLAKFRLSSSREFFTSEHGSA